jgi:phosphate transport system protein
MTASELQHLDLNTSMMTHHDQELAQLKELLLLMAGHARNAVTRAIQALVGRDEALARRVIEDDSIVDQLEIKVDDVALHLLAKAPLASDLRLITIAMKASHDLERVCDEATTIARRAIELNSEPQLKPYIDLPKMSQIALEMLDHAINAFVNGRSQEARDVIQRDKEVDLLNKQLHRELASYMIEKPATITRALNLMVVSKALERIADHATNIGEEVVYLYEGRDIRHAGQNRDGL